MNLQTMRHSRESGRSMVEMLGVLAIIGVLSVGGIAGYSKAMGKFKLTKATDQISMLVANIRTLYSGQRSYSGLNNQNAISFGVVPSEMVASDKRTITNAFAGSVTIASSNNDMNFSITFGGMGKEAAVTLATADWGSGSGSGLVSMSLGNSGSSGSSSHSGGALSSADNNLNIGTASVKTTPKAVPSFDYGSGGNTFTIDKLPLGPAEATAAFGNVTGDTCSITWTYY